MTHAPLHCILVPTGSAGDVHPFIGIGRMLRRRGHEVTVITNGRFRDATQRAGVVFVEHGTAEEFEEAVADPELWHPLRGVGYVMRMVSQNMRRQYELIEQVYEPGRSVLVHHTLSFGSRVFEEKHGAPAASLHIAPMCFRTIHRLISPSVRWDLSFLPAPLKRAAWRLIDRWFVDPHITPELNRWRSELGLSPVSRPFNDWLHSPNCVVGMFPQWFSPKLPDWPAHVELTGFPLFDEAGQHALSDELESFLAAGDPPLAFTPGTAMRHGEKFFRAAIDATAMIRRRALLLTRYRQTLPADLPDHVLHVPYAPFSELLPRCAAIVHHGGIGTTAQGLAAGVPQFIMPMGFDQPDNTACLARLGVATWLTPRRFTAKRLAKRLDALLLSPQIAAACARCAQLIRTANPIERTIDLIEQAAGRTATPPPSTHPVGGVARHEAKPQGVAPVRQT